jgi:hypothetical protein
MEDDRFEDASAKCQIHGMTMENGVIKMRPEVKPGENSRQVLM